MPPYWVADTFCLVAGSRGAGATRCTASPTLGLADRVTRPDRPPLSSLTSGLGVTIAVATQWSPELPRPDECLAAIWIVRSTEPHDRSASRRRRVAGTPCIRRCPLPARSARALLPATRGHPWAPASADSRPASRLRVRTTAAAIPRRAWPYDELVRRVITIRGESVAISEESRFACEQELEDAVKAHPEALPSQDLGLGPLFAMGSQLDFGSGPLDLLCVDAQGHLAIVEFKRGSENPDVRKVVAQMLDYGSALWRTPYEDLVERCERGLQVPWETHLADRCAALEEPLDPESFQDGVARSLDAGDFAFLYVARDVDPRTRQVMTYLAEGPRMRFLGVEVELYRHPSGDEAVLVPRTAFVPSWIAGRESANAGRQPSPAIVIDDAAPAVRDLIEKMDALTEDLGLRTRPTRSGWAYHRMIPDQRADNLPSGMVIYPRRQAAEFNLQIFRDHGADELANDLHQRLQRITGTPPADKFPMVPCLALTRDWEAARLGFVEPYFKARTQLNV
jgi:hypothetical protein